jgi:Peptidase propeptide and YPEB domain
MVTSTSFKLAAGVFGAATLAKVSAFAAAIMLIGAGPGHAGSLGRPCTAAPQNQWLSMETLQSKLEAKGYTIRGAKLKNACGEVYATDAQGTRIELFLDPTSGEIVGRL